ncbi:aminoacyl-histidine dipeptidase [Finegoldia magna]|uniref:Cytosol non-specific dipeptidase n=1 Tax=Finegoldia magna TaxID=1260 RepID=A0A233VWA3_FINMA|nr:beta-Ala-His dipeptidase [Finegoldia magna]OXZ36663.1 aminoacyl-histidine dipeptidase [Finegoldia magna]
MKNIVLENFRELSNVPRCSFDQKRINEYLVNKAKELGLEYDVDDELNIVIRKPATEDKKGHPGVILQGHMDMVCEKEDDSDHDFTKDPIEFIIENGKLTANKTTLGADNGIAVAMGIAILQDENLSHPDLELMITTNEEVGLIGANAVSEDFLKGKYLINVDSEEEGIMTCGCAGGITLNSEFAIKREEFGKYFYKIAINGFRGGHSGQDIDKNHLNAIESMVSILKELSTRHNLRIVSLNGGTKHNAIPRNCELIIASEDEIKDNEINIDGFKQVEAKMEFIFEQVDSQIPMDAQTSEHILNFLTTIPNGVVDMVKGNDNLVETSLNQSIATTEDDKFVFMVSIRSSVLDKIKEVEDLITNTTKSNSGIVKSEGFYEPWEYREDSELRDKCLKVYKEVTGKDMQVNVIHAGLECAVFSKKYPDMDMISIGPDMSGVHTPKETLDLESTDRVYEFLKKLVESL